MTTLFWANDIPLAEWLDQVTLFSALLSGGVFIAISVLVYFFLRANGNLDTIFLRAFVGTIFLWGVVQFAQVFVPPEFEIWFLPFFKLAGVLITFLSAFALFFSLLKLKKVMKNYKESNIYFKKTIKELSGALETAQKWMELERSQMISLFRQAPVMVNIYKGPDHVFDFMHPLAKALFAGVDFTGKSLRETRPYRSQDYIHQMDEVYQTGKTFVGQELGGRFLDENGFFTEKFFNVTFMALRDLNYEIIGVMTFAYEVTDQVTTRMRLERSSMFVEKLQTVTAALSSTLTAEEVASVVITQALGALGADRGMLTLFNPVSQKLEVIGNAGYGSHMVEAWKSALGLSGPWPFQECVRKKSFIFIEDLDTWKQNWPDTYESAVQTGDAAFIAMPLLFGDKVLGAFTISFEVGRKFKDDERAFVKSLAEQCSQALERARLFELEANTRKNNEDQQKWLEAVLNAMPTPLILIEPGSSRILFSNRAAHNLGLGLPHGRGADNSDSYYGSQFDGTKIPNRNLPSARAARGERLNGFDYFWRTPYGTTALTVKSELLPAMYGHPATIIIPFQDVTKLKKIEEDLQQAVKARDEFLSIASHELKTPITTLKLQLQMAKLRMKRESGASGPREKLDQILESSHRQVNRLTSLVEDLLDVTRVRSKKLTLAFEEVEVANLILEILGHFKEQILQSKCEIRVHLEEGIQACWDRPRVEQILVNLFSNALKYAPKKPIDVSLKCENDLAVIRVQDYGPGIPIDKQTLIFQRFERVTDSRTITGLGLGLFIVKQIVEAHSGTVHVESEYGNGSCFVVELPLRPVVKDLSLLA